MQFKTIKTYSASNLCVSLIFLLISGVMVAQDAFKLPAYSKFQLKNGLTVYLMEQHEVPLIELTAVFRAGAIHDSENKNGIASATADALVLGTEKYTKKQIEEAIDFVGASLNTGAGKEAGFLSASFLKKDQDQLLAIVKEILANPTFSKEEWKKIQRRKLLGLDQIKESPRSSITSYYNNFVYQNHPYGNPTAGNKKAVASITTEDLSKFYKTYYTTETAAIALVGDFNTADMKKKITQIFGKWKTSRAKNTVLPELKNQEKSRVLLVNKTDATETTFLIGGPGIPRNNPDFVGIQVINTVLGGRFTSWLNDALRVNSGLTYGARSRFRPYAIGGSFTISTFTANKNTEKAIDLALETYGKLHKDGIDTETLVSAKNYVKGQFPPRYETNASLTNLLTDMFLYDFNESYINTFAKQVDELNETKAKEIIEAYFPKDKLQFVLIGKDDEIGEIAKKYGAIERKEITADGF